MSLDRERDEFGRPRNARPRDGLGRPLARGDSGFAGVADDLVLSPDESLREAQRLLDEGHPFHAHEVLEATWKSAPTDERDLWQGLAQLAVGLTHALRGNNVGAAAVLRRGVDHISGYVDARPHGVDVAGLLAWARTLGGQLADPSTDAGPPSVPTLVGT
jgi:uncharacterized protein